MQTISFKWRISQIFGDNTYTEDIDEKDKISTLEFDKTGDYIAVGDNNGRVILFQSDNIKNQSSSESDISDREIDIEESENGSEKEKEIEDEFIKKKKKQRLKYKFYTEFQSHEASFDYIKSLEVSEKINKIQWIKRRSQSHLLLTTNDQSIKLWKIITKKIRSFDNINSKKEQKNLNSENNFHFPKMEVTQVEKKSTNTKIYGDAHVYNINSISLSCDDETFISSDDLRINLWNLERSDKAFNIVDIKPENIKQLSEVITCSQFHPSECSEFIYSTSKGIINYADLRQGSKCNESVRRFQDVKNLEKETFFDEIVSNITDIKFSPCGRYILSRDFTSLKVWDLNMENQPLSTFYFHDFSHNRFNELYESDYIFDRFKCNWSGDGKYAMTGSYEDYYYIFDWKKNKGMLVDCSKTTTVYSEFYDANSEPNNENGFFENSENNNKLSYNSEKINLRKKILDLSFNPNNSFLAVAATNILYLFTGDEYKNQQSEKQNQNEILM
ncbi:protein phosphatase pp2a regulatory subunit b [Anaeramoeba flamelloides]|uniref:Serine/threonine-protein phosphatase 2A 55 kDa regulatory subunit B n=1 Tax=Anaeramoeba flamelloides TaxID=1746091 RepID=A0ABQ8YPV0_9EUKA|nr:protein phosphatase pp2a regulatory subunit b [Anaeramoeba flamelloides]